VEFHMAQITYAQSIHCVSFCLVKVHKLQSSCRRPWIVEKGEDGRQQCQRSQSMGSQLSRTRTGKIQFVRRAETIAQEVVDTNTHMADSDRS
jgi:hypothetical protein